MEKEQITYTLILHNIRKKIKLSLMEYCLADSIYHLSNNPRSKVKGWCFATKNTIARILGTSSQTIFDNLIKLINKGFVEKDEETRYIRTTNKWYESVVLVKAQAEYQETLHPIKKLDRGVSRNFTPTIKKLDTYNNKDNDIDKDLREKILKEAKEKLIKSKVF